MAALTTAPPPTAIATAASTSTAYISIGPNRSSSCSLTTESGVFVYGAGRTLACWDTVSQLFIQCCISNVDTVFLQTSNRGVYATLLGHRGDVTTLKRVRSENGCATLVSGDSVGEVRIWREGEDKSVRIEVQLHGQ